MLPSRSPNRFAPRVEARSQVLAYRIPVTGTGLALHYASDRVPGRRAAHQLRIPLRGTTLPSDVEEIAVEVTVGDRQFVQRFPATETSYLYDGEPADSGLSALASTESAVVRVGYVHRAIWPRPERIQWREHAATLGVWDARRHGLGGWTLTPHHALDSVAATLYFGDGSQRTQGAVDRKEHPSGEVRIPSESGAEIYAFDSGGRHLRTLDAVSGADRYAFTHDGEGRLAGARIADEQLCRIERGGERTEMRIVAPGGAHTNLLVDEAGYLSAVVDPSGARLEMRHAPDGLLLEIVDPLGNAYRFRYDELGRLSSEQHPDGSGSELRRTTTEKGFKVRRSTATGAELVYGVERLPGGVIRRTSGCCAGGGQTIADHHPDGHRALTYPDGSTLEIEDQPDPRFGSAAPLIRRLLRRTPSGLTGEAVFSREVSVDPGDPTALTTQTERMLLNGRPFVTQVHGPERRVTFSSPEGRTATATIDVAGRLIAGEAPGFAPIQVERDATGGMTGAVMGSHRVAVLRDDRGRSTRVEFEAGRTLQYEFDTADRRVATVSSGSLRRGFDYDAAGNLTSLTAPSGASHRFAYGPTNRWTSYEVPTGGRYEAGYDADGRPTLARLPGGREVRMEYDETGWLRVIRSPEAVVELRHDAGGRLAGASRKPTGDEGAQELAFVHDGPLVTSASWRGPTTAAVGYTYDTDFRLASIGLDGKPARQLKRDGDGLITAIGPFSVARDGPGGAVSGITDGRLAIEMEFDASGRIAGRTHRVSGKDIYRLRVERNEVEGIRARQEVVVGRTMARTYAYDAEGQLVGVSADGSAPERYRYDANGNRIHLETSQGAATGTFDAADRQLTLGDQARDVDGDGFLRRRGDETFEYGARGELLRVTNPDGGVVSYTYDGLVRLVARTDAAGTEQYILNHVAPFGELLASRSPNGALTEYYFDAEGKLFALVRADAWYYVACDEIGTPRIVVDAGGSVVKVLEHDAFGVALTDSNPDFELRIGFAGGIVDPSSGLIHFGRRDYDPQAGRWTTPDPAGFGGGDTNLYRYVWNDPVNFRDPAGTQLWPQPYQHQSSTDPHFEPEPPDISDPSWVYDTGPQQWEQPRTDTYPVTAPGTSPLDNLAGSEPTPGGEYWKPGWNWNKYTRKGWSSECQGSVGGIGPDASPYSPTFPGADPGGGRDAEPSRRGVQGTVRF